MAKKEGLEAPAPPSHFQKPRTLDGKRKNWPEFDRCMEGAMEDPSMDPLMDPRSANLETNEASATQRRQVRGLLLSACTGAAGVLFQHRDDL